MSDRLITVAIHTMDRANRLRQVLEREGVKVSLQNVDLSVPQVFSGVRMRIAESDLPLALRIIENIEIFAPTPLHKDAVAADDRHPILVPTDFSDSALGAAVAAMRIAAVHGVKVHLLHTFIDPTYATRSAMQLSSTLDYEPLPVDEMAEVAAEHEISKIARSKMKEFEEKLRDKIKHGLIPPVNFDSEVTEGLPEEMIADYAGQYNPLAIVMGTHGSQHKDRSELGSVTAEVLDSCRATVLAIPDSVNTLSSGNARHLVFFASSGQDDILALDALYRLLPEAQLAVTLVSLPSNRFTGDSAKAGKNLLAYCKEHYPAYTFSLSPLSLSNPVDDFNRIAEHHKVDIIAMGTRKKNILVRLFSPTLAHKLLFHADIPLLSIPV